MELKIKLKSKQIRGAGRGQRIGFPTINLMVPNNIEMDDGIYAVRVLINDKKYMGALHYGPIPTFDEKGKTMEVYLLDVNNKNSPKVGDNDVEVEIVKFLRKIKKFKGISDLTEQIEKDVSDTRAILSTV